MKKSITSSLTLLTLSLILTGCSTHDSSKNKDTSTKGASSAKIAISKKASSHTKNNLKIKANKENTKTANESTPEVATKNVASTNPVSELSNNVTAKTNPQAPQTNRVTQQAQPKNETQNTAHSIENQKQNGPVYAPGSDTYDWIQEQITQAKKDGRLDANGHPTGKEGYGVQVEVPDNAGHAVTSIDSKPSDFAGTTIAPVQDNSNSTAAQQAAAIAKLKEQQAKGEAHHTAAEMAEIAAQMKALQEQIRQEKGSSHSVNGFESISNSHNNQASTAENDVEIHSSNTN